MTRPGVGRAAAVAAGALVVLGGIAAGQPVAPPPPPPDAGAQPAPRPPAPPPGPTPAAEPGQEIPELAPAPRPSSLGPVAPEFLGPPVAGPDGGPVVLGEHRGEWKLWDLRSFRTSLEFYGQFDNDRQSQEGAPTLHQRDNLLRASTNLSFEAYVGHKNFLDLNGTFNIGYEDERILTDATSGDEHTTSPFGIYDFSARFLGESTLPTTLYSRREELHQDRDFASSIKTITFENGAIVELKSDVIPTRIQYFHRQQDQTDPLGFIDEHDKQDTLALQCVWRLTDNQRIEAFYTFDHVDQTQGTTFQNTFDRHDATITHLLTFGDTSENSARTSLHIYDESGLFAQQRLQLDEQVLLKHSDTLDSSYSLTAEDLKRGDLDQRQLTGSASVHHRLFQSLISTATVGGTILDEPGEFRSTSEFITGTLDYTKKVPFGRLDAAAGLGFNHQDNSDRGNTVTVFDESHTFTDPFDIIIPRRNIITGSVFITDLTHIPKSEGLDYTVTYLIDRVEIHRQPFGTIANGQTVLVTYQVGPEPGSRIDTTTQTYSVRYTFEEGWLNGLSLYGYYQRTDHSLDTVDPSAFVLDNVSDWRYGAEYRLGDLDLLVERQNHESTVSPFDRNRYQLRYNTRFTREALLSLELTRDEVVYRDINNHADLNSILLRYSHHLKRGLDLDLYLRYRDDHDELNGNVRGFEQAIEVHWQHRQTSLFATFRNAELTGGGTDRLTQTITVGLTRSF
jgi:hypothetical protein